MIFYVDGACHGNPGPGGFGVVIVGKDGEIIETYNQTQENTTNNEQEMKAIIYAVCRAKLAGEAAEIYSDSAYAINCFSSWMYNWHDNGWLKSDGQVPKNLDLVKAYYELSRNYPITFHKVAGHTGNKYNELADKLASSPTKSETWIEKLDIPTKMGIPYGL